MKGLKSTIKWVVAIVLICAIAVGLASINGLHVSRTVITLAGNEISEAEYKLYLEMAKQQVLSEQGVTDEEAAKEFIKNGKVEEKNAADYIKDKAMEQILRIEVANVKAAEANVSLTDEERSGARNTAGTEEYLTMLKTDAETYATVMEKSYIADKYYTSLIEGDAEMFAVADEEIAEAVSEGYALVQHVLVKNTPEADAEGNVPEVEGYAEEAKKKAEDVLAKAVAGEDFAGLIAEFGEDPGMEATPEGYLITEQGYTIDGQSQMVPEFTAGAFAVAAGEVNPALVESSYGWHIIKRLAVPETHADYATISEGAKSMKMSEKYEAYLDELAKSMEIVKKDNVIAGIKVNY